MLWLIDRNTGQITKKLRSNFKMNSACRLTSDDKCLLSDSLDDQLECIEVASESILWRVAIANRHAIQMHSSAIVSNDRVIAYAAQSEAILLDLKTGAELRRLPHPDRLGQCVFLNRPGFSTEIATTCRDGRIRLWDVSSGDLQRDFLAHAHGTDALAISADGTLLASSGFDRTVRVWNVADLSQRIVLPIGCAQRLGFFGPDNHLVCGEANVSIWSIIGPTERLQLSREYEIRTFGLSPDGRTLAMERGNQIELIHSDTH